MRYPRLDFPGARHHVMNRGGRRGPIFVDDADCCVFLDILGTFPQRFGVRVHGYALMPNHYHLMLESTSGHLSRAMHELGRDYTQRHNRRHKVDGQVFRGRFHNRVVGNERYWQHLLAYLHLNPVRAGLGTIDDAEWTSHRAYLGEDSRPPWLTTSELQALFGSIAAYRAYVDAVANGVADAPSDFDPKKLWLPNSTGTVAVMPPDDSALAVSDALAEVAAATGLSLEEVLAAPRGRTGNPANWFAVWWLVRGRGIAPSRVARGMATTAASISMRIKRVEERLDVDPQLREWVERLRVGSRGAGR